jgi:steroid Delta-isomerase
MINERATALVAFFESFALGSVADMGRYYAKSAYFKDPFNEVRDLVGIQHVFLRMYETTLAPRFTISEVFYADEAVMLRWDFDFRIKSWRPAVPRRIRGVSHIRFGPDGLVTYHRDYWDAAEELYEQLPVIGSVMRLFKKLAR